MTATQRFIEKAIQGYEDERLRPFSEIDLQDAAWILLNPKAWQAVGKVSGWSVEEGYKVSPVLHKHDGELCSRAICETVGVSKIWPEWLANMHRMTDALAEGKTIEEYLATIV